VEPKYNDILIALADATNDLSMHCQEQRAGAAPGTHLVQKARERSGSPRFFLQTRFIDTMILINPASTYVKLFQSRPQVHNDFLKSCFHLSYAFSINPTSI